MLSMNTRYEFDKDLRLGSQMFEMVVGLTQAEITDNEERYIDMDEPCTLYWTYGKPVTLKSKPKFDKVKPIHFSISITFG